MIIYPAIDLRGGKVVRLKEGNPNHETVFSDNPIAVLQRWLNEGATWVHMVNLDGAFDQANDNLNILKEAARLGGSIQFGGGLRSLDDAETALNHGAARVVLGTLAVTNPELLPQAVNDFGAERVCVALDARDGRIATHGWQQSTELKPLELGRRIAAMGVRHALYTDVKRDGSMVGANIHDTIVLGRDTGLQVIASGGVTTMEEIHQLARSQMVAGAVIGMALYEDKLTLTEALIAARSSNVS